MKYRKTERGRIIMRFNLLNTGIYILYYIIIHLE